MIQLPVDFGLSDRPVVFGSNGQSTMKCGGDSMNFVFRSALAHGSLALMSLPPCSM